MGPSCLLGSDVMMKSAEYSAAFWYIRACAALQQFKFICSSLTIEMVGDSGTVGGLLTSRQSVLVGCAFVTSGVMVFGNFYVLVGCSLGRIFAVRRLVSG